MLIFFILIFLIQDKVPPAVPKNLEVFASEFEFSTEYKLVWNQSFIKGDSLKNYFVYFGKDLLNYDSLDVDIDTKIDLIIISQDTILFSIGALYYNSGLSAKTKWIKYPTF